MGRVVPFWEFQAARKRGFPALLSVLDGRPVTECELCSLQRALTVGACYS
jgi:hypothetical protein